MHDELTLALALTETLMLSAADTEAAAAVPAQEMVFPLSFVDALIIAWPVADTSPACAHAPRVGRRERRTNRDLRSM